MSKIYEKCVSSPGFLLNSRKLVVFCDLCEFGFMYIIHVDVTLCTRGHACIFLRSDFKNEPKKAKQNKKNRKIGRTKLVGICYACKRKKLQNKIVSAAKDARTQAKILKKTSRTLGVGDWSSGGNKTKFHIEHRKWKCTIENFGMRASSIYWINFLDRPLKKERKQKKVSARIRCHWHCVWCVRDFAVAIYNLFQSECRCLCICFSSSELRWAELRVQEIIMPFSNIWSISTWFALRCHYLFLVCNECMVWH